MEYFHWECPSRNRVRRRIAIEFGELSSVMDESVPEIQEIVACLVCVHCSGGDDEFEVSSSREDSGGGKYPEVEGKGMPTFSQETH